MKSLILLFALMPFLVATESNFTAWKWQQPIIIQSPGLVRLALLPETIHASQTSFADLRIISPTGIETPYLIELCQPTAPESYKAINFKASIIDSTTVLTADSPTDQEISAITLETPSRDFIKPIKIETRKTGEDWITVAPNELIFHESTGAKRLEISTQAAAFAKLRLTINDSRSKPVPFTDIKLTAKDIQIPTIDHAVQLLSRDEQNSNSIIKIDLGARNLDLGSLQLHIPDAIFNRRCSLFYLSSEKDESTNRTLVTTHNIYGVSLDLSASAKHSFIPIHKRIPSRFILLIIENGDSPPLTITGASAYRYPANLIFFAKQPGTWQLLTGYPQATPPRYDLSPLSAKLSNATVTASPGPIASKTDYHAPSPLPEIAPTGANIDLTHWSYRRKITGSSLGVIQIQTDALTLANSQTHLADLRMIQNSRQLPFVIDQTTHTETLKPTIEIDNDPKRPSLSRWKITMPIDDLPVVELRAKSNSPLFSRSFHLISQQQDTLGSPLLQIIAQANWSQNASSRIHSDELKIPIQGQRLPKSFYLQTDNGDNPAITIDDISIRFEAPSLTLKVTDPSPLFLYYGNANANRPNYDLQLVTNKLHQVEKQPASLGPEEILTQKNHDNLGLSSGSPWLWIVLGLVVAVLLGVVAKLLPKESI